MTMMHLIPVAFKYDNDQVLMGTLNIKLHQKVRLNHLKFIIASDTSAGVYRDNESINDYPTNLSHFLQVIQTLT